MEFRLGYIFTDRVGIVRNWATGSGARYRDLVENLEDFERPPQECAALWEY